MQSSLRQVDFWSPRGGADFHDSTCDNGREPLLDSKLHRGNDAALAPWRKFPLLNPELRRMVEPEISHNTTKSDEPATGIASSTATALMLWLAAVVASAAVLRIWAACDELWLDEIWTLAVFARKVRSPLDIFTFHHDNNHYLITFWMYLVGTEVYSSLVYRLPSLLAGIGTVALAAKAASRWGGSATVFAAILTGGSHFLIYFSAQARGYALAGFFALAAFLAMERYLATRSRAANALFVACICGGILSHLTFIEFFFATIIWSTVVCFGYARSTWQALRDLAALHLLPGIFFGILYLVDLRVLANSPDSYVLSDVLIHAASLAVGSTNLSAAGLALSAFVAFMVGGAAIYRLSKEEPDLWIFFAAIIFFVPALMLSVLRPPVLYERFFYINILFFLLAASFLLSRLWRSPGIGQSLAAVATLVYVAGNATHIYDVVSSGRAHHLEALEYIAQHAQDEETEIADSSTNFRTDLYVKFYTPLLPQDRRYVAAKISAEMRKSPEWILVEDIPEPTPTLSIEGRTDGYRLARVFRAATLEAPAMLALYHREGQLTDDAQK